MGDGSSLKGESWRSNSCSRRSGCAMHSRQGFLESAFARELIEGREQCRKFCIGLTKKQASGIDENILKY
jgi:hypothetical protein